MSEESGLEYLGRVTVRILIDKDHLQELVTQAIADHAERVLHFRVVQEEGAEE